MLTAQISVWIQSTKQFDSHHPAANNLVRCPPNQSYMLERTVFRVFGQKRFLYWRPLFSSKTVSKIFIVSSFPVVSFTEAATAISSKLDLWDVSSSRNLSSISWMYLRMSDRSKRDGGMSMSSLKLPVLIPYILHMLLCPRPPSFSPTFTPI